jgi:serine/threonine-protein kinase
MESIGKYQVISRIGGGNFGDVFYVYDRALQVNKAIKVVASNNAESLLKQLDEAAILYKCKNKYIVEVNEANIMTVNGKNCVVIDMEYIPNGSLEDQINNGHISLIEAVKYTCDILNGLECAHEKGIIHRDVKPANVLLQKKSAKLSDFGLATELNEGEFASGQGYISHLAPECFPENGNPLTNISTDIFATGITLFRLVNNIEDWKKCINSIPNCKIHASKGLLIKKIGYKGYVPTQLKRIISKACNPYSDKRYKSVADFRQALEKLNPQIYWYKKSDLLWNGIDKKSGKTLEICADKKKCYLKRNNRKDNNYTYEYSQVDEAIVYIEKLVADLSFG